MSTTSFMSSVSWMAEKSSADLIPMLKNAYHALKDKERDLMLAAEIGKSLLENNIAMKNRYEELLNNTRSTPMIKASLDTSPITGGGAALPTPSSSVLTNNQQYESDSGIGGSSCDDDDYDENDTSNAMRFVPSRSTREAMIEVLELKNTELNAHLETILEEQAHMDKSNTKKHRELEQEISALTNSLEIATSKIQELEDMNKRANQRRSGDSHTDSSNDDVDRQMMEDLLNQIDNLKTENDTTLQSKIDLETKLANTLQDLRKLKEQFDHFQFTKDDHEDLKAAYERQFRHIDELNASVEEHRTMLQKLKDRGIPIHSTHNTPAPSCINGEYSLDSSASGFRNTLLSELENEWIKQQQQQQQQQQPSTSADATSTKEFVSSPTSFLKPVFPSLSLKDLSSFTGQSISAMYQQSDFGMESVLARAAGVDHKTLEEAIRFVDRLEDRFGQDGSNNEQDDDDWLLGLTNDLGMSPLDGQVDEEGNQHLLTMFDPAFPRDGLYPDATAALVHVKESDLAVGYPKTFSGKIQNTVRLFFKAVWRWCRFAVILSTAVLISVWNGPDYMLLEN
ncbi:hypothetical protein BC941DRAFT_452742 [Chlamydoabsidia padenii]|nr:hypothetical protein BC941DRAFT_452742 [Chlamydoabsidia padenii]